MSNSNKIPKVEILGKSRGLIKRTKTVGIYLSKEEVEILKRQARDRGLSVPAYIRMLIRQHGERGL